MSILHCRIAGAEANGSPGLRPRVNLPGDAEFVRLAAKNPAHIAEFCKRLSGGEPYQEVWADLSGTSYEQAMQEANAYCRKRVSKVLGEEYKPFAQLRQASDRAMRGGAEETRAWLAAGGEAALRQWLKTSAGHPAAPRFQLQGKRRYVVPVADHGWQSSRLRHAHGPTGLDRGVRRRGRRRDAVPARFRLAKELLIRV